MANRLYGWNVCRPLVRTPHTLIAGTTGSGKSVMLNSVIYTAIAEGGRFVLIDLKRVELARYKKMAVTKAICTEPEDVVPTLNGVVEIMENRYKRMKGRMYDGKPLYVVIDELADLVSNKKALELIVKIGRLGRAAQVHLICATQDPSRKTLPAALMQNFTTTVALRCRSAIESRQIIGIPGAEKLPKYGYGIQWDADGTHNIDIPLTDERMLEEQIREVTFWRLARDCGFFRTLFGV